MLRQLIIENFVLIEKAEIEFGPGLTVITGETGAGKSLVVKALKLILGAKGEKRLIGNFGKKAVIQALFDMPKALSEFFEERGMDVSDELILRRIISPDGKSRIFINGVLSTVQDLKSISPYLISISSQHEFQKLGDPENHKRWLDEFGRIELFELKGLFHETKKEEEALSRLLKLRSRESEKRLELERDARLIDELALKEGEEEELIREREILRETERIKRLGNELYRHLDGEKGSVLERLSECKILLDRLSGIDEGLRSLFERLESLFIECQDIFLSIKDYLYDLPQDNSRLRKVDERLFKIRELKRRFGPEIEDIFSYRNKIERELKGLDELSQRIENQKKRVKGLQERLLELSKKISKRRHEVSRDFSSFVLRELKGLNLPNASFEARVISPPTPEPSDCGPKGFDEVVFYFSANPGRRMEPVSKVASGGELSRILLALKVVLGRTTEHETVIFDEIDTGLGGEVAENIGKKLKKIGESSQVIAITHFPQIAALSKGHIQVEKILGGKETKTLVRSLSREEERVQEIVRMLGGETKKAKEYAKEMLGPFFRRA